MTAQLTQARTYYQKADELAGQAAQKVHEAREILTQLKPLDERITAWEQNLANTPYVLWSILFVIIAIAEYYISLEIYRVIFPGFPWLMALAFFIIGLFISHFLADKLIKPLQSIKYYEYRQNPQYAELTDEEILEIIRKENRKHFIWGLAGAIILIAVIFALAYRRVQLEIEAEVRQTGMGLFDILPALLYMAELFLGMYFVTFLQLLRMRIKRSSFERKLDKYIDEINRLTADVVKFFQKAQEKGLDLIDSTVNVSDEIQTAFYREAHLSTDDRVKYLEVPQTKDYPFKFQLVDQNNRPLSKHVEVITHYKAKGSGATDESGRGLIVIHTHEEDYVEAIYIGDTANEPARRLIKGTYPLGDDHMHVIKING